MEKKQYYLNKNKQNNCINNAMNLNINENARDSNSDHAMSQRYNINIDQEYVNIGYKS